MRSQHPPKRREPTTSRRNTPELSDRAPPAEQGQRGQQEPGRGGRAAAEVTASARIGDDRRRFGAGPGREVAGVLRTVVGGRALLQALTGAAAAERRATGVLAVLVDRLEAVVAALVANADTLAGTTLEARSAVLVDGAAGAAGGG